MRITFFILMIFEIDSCYSQKGNVFGIAELSLLSLHKSDTIYIYNTTNLKDKYIGIFDASENQDHVFYYDDFKSDPRKLSSIREYLVNFSPRFFYPDYNILFPVVVGESEYFYKIKINEEEYKYLSKNSSFFEFLSFTYLFDRYEVLIDESNKFYESPDIKSAIVEVDYNLTYEVISIDGDWAKLRSLEPLYYEIEVEEDSLEYEGWTMWKKDEIILIEFLFHP